MDAAARHRLLDVSSRGSLLVRDKTFSDSSDGWQGFGDEETQGMQVEGCVHGGNLLMAGKALKELTAASNFTWANRSEEYTALGERLVETCHLAANQTVTRLPPLEFIFDRDNEARYPASSGYAFSSGIARSYFIAYRLTGRQRYREYAAGAAAGHLGSHRRQGGPHRELGPANRLRPRLRREHRADAPARFCHLRLH